jgi:hypothetical protein
MKDLITEARELATENISQPTVFYKDKSQRIMLRLCDALEKAEERGQGCEHCQGWDTRSGAQYCPMCGKKLPVYAGTIGGEIVQHALKELGAEEGAEHERD